MARTKDFEATVARMQKFEQDAMTKLLEGLGKTWDASDFAYFADAATKGRQYMETLKKVFNGEKLAG